MSERERALRHIARTSHGQRAKKPKFIRLLSKIRNAIQQLRSARLNKKSP
jgi:hypothetical protein